MWGEISALTQIIKEEHVPNADAIYLEMIADYHHRYGEGTLGSHAAAFIKEYNARIRSELERNGYDLTKPARLAERMLELLTPMTESYDNVIILKDMMKMLRDAAAGKTE